MDAIASGYEHRSDAAGVTEPVIRRLIVAFYAKVRRDPALGPVFENIIDDWGTHIETVCAFWLYATRLDRSYNGRNFIPAHVKHPTIQPALLPRWLHLFRETADELCSAPAADALVDIAKRMAVSVEMSLNRRDREAAAGRA